MLSFEDFCEKVKNEMVQYMTQEYHNAVFKLVDIIKENDEKHTSLEMETEQNLVPNLYLEECYHVYQKTGNIEATMQLMAQKYQESLNQGEKIIGFDIGDYEQVKERLFLSVLNKGKNEQYIQNYCYKEVPGTDLAAVTKILCHGNEEEQAVIPVNEDYLSVWGVSKEEVYEQAFLNTPKLFPLELMNMKDVIRNYSLMQDIDPGMASLLQSMPEPDQSEPFVLLPDEYYVLSNRQKTNGATALLYPEAMQKIAEGTGSNFFILPSSIHELILVKDTGDIRVEDLQEMVISVNRTTLQPEEFLSDEIYCYDCREHRISMATDREQTKNRIEEYLKEDDMEFEEER